MNPHGLLLPDAFEWIGRSLTFTEHPIARNDVIRYAVAVGLVDSTHFDVETAGSVRQEDVVVPLSYYTVIRQAALTNVPLSELGDDGISLILIPPNRGQRILAGGTRVLFDRRMRVGDVITPIASLTGLREKVGKSGPLAIVDYRFVYRDATGDTVAEETYTRIIQ